MDRAVFTTRRGFVSGAIAATAVAFPAKASVNPSEMETFDPLADLIRRYREQIVYFDANAPDDETINGFAERTYAPLYEKLSSNPPAPTTRAGAITGLEFVNSELTEFSQSDAGRCVLRVCLRYLRSDSLS